MHAEPSAADCRCAYDTVALDGGGIALHLVSAARHSLGDNVTDAQTFSSDIGHRLADASTDAAASTGQLAHRLTDAGLGLLICFRRQPTQIRRPIDPPPAKL
jgi:hypothetical protein